MFITYPVTAAQLAMALSAPVARRLSARLLDVDQARAGISVRQASALEQARCVAEQWRQATYRWHIGQAYALLRRVEREAAVERAVFQARMRAALPHLPAKYPKLSSRP